MDLTAEAMKDANKKSNLFTNFREVFWSSVSQDDICEVQRLMESDDEIIQDIIEAFVSEGVVDDSLWPRLRIAVKDHIAVLEKEEAEENKMHILEDVDMDDAKSTSGSDSLMAQTFCTPTSMATRQALMTQ